MRTCARRAVSNVFFLFLVVALATVAIVFAVLYFNTIKSSQEARDESAKYVGIITGSDRKLPKSLDPRFKDADGDLIADAPTDPKQLVNPDTLYFCFTAETPEAYKDAWKDFMDHLSKVTGKKVEYLSVSTPDEQINALLNGKLHVTGFNTGSVPISVNLAGFVPAFTLGTPDVGGYLHSEMIVPADSSIQSPADLQNHSITFVDLNSNSGSKAPIVFLRNKFNLLPERDYTIRYSYGHERSIEGIADKTYEAAAVASDVLARAVASKKIAATQYRSIYASDNFPAVALGWAYNLDPALVAKIRTAFTTFDFKGTSVESRFASSKQNNFHPISYKNDFTVVRFIDDEIGRPYQLHPVDTAPTTAPAPATQK